MIVYAEFAESSAVPKAIEKVRAWGPAELETYSPYPIPRIEGALAARRSRLSLAVLAAGLGGAAGAYGLQWLLNAYLYPLDVGGRPPHFPLAFVPITFEMGVLFASLTAFVGVLVGGRLMRLWHSVFEVHGIESATGSHVWLEITVPDDADLVQLGELLRAAGAIQVRSPEVRT